MGETVRVTVPDGRVFYVKREDYSMYTDNEVDASEFFRAAGVPGMYRARASNIHDNVTIMESTGVGLDLRSSAVPRNETFARADAADDVEHIASQVVGGEDHLMRMAMLDMAIGNIDRHEGNIMLGNVTTTSQHILPLDHSWAVTQQPNVDPVSIANTEFREDGSPVSGDVSLYSIFFAAAIRARRRSATRRGAQIRATEEDAAKFAQIIEELRDAAARAKLSEDGAALINYRLDQMSERSQEMLDALFNGATPLYIDQ